MGLNFSISAARKEWTHSAKKQKEEDSRGGRYTSWVQGCNYVSAGFQWKHAYNVDASVAPLFSRVDFEVAGRLTTTRNALSDGSFLVYI